MLKASEVLAATKAVCADFEFTGVTTDSRAVKPGELFVALKGDNFDGHDYCAKAVELGAAGVVVSHEVSGLPAGVAVFMVEDTLLAYQQLAHAYRLRKQGLKVFAITGSNGKTSTKDLLAACLSCKYNVVKTQGNFNNEIGLPKTYHLHTLRHFFVSTLLHEGVDKNTVADLAGHGDTSFLERTYCHPQMQLKQDAAKRMSNSLFATPNPELLVS